ncbi:MAG: cytochrome c oxidase subunit II [Egibacteraceae bacterium]
MQGKTELDLVRSAGSLDPQGPVAEVMADLWWLMLGLGVVVFAVFAALLAVGLLRRRSAEDAEPARGPTFSRWIVSGGVVMPVIVLIVVFGATVRAMRVLPATAPGEALVVEIVGHQWWWEVRYPAEGITTANELHIPVGRPIALELTSADVIHSFWVPALGGKMDLLPDGVNTLVLQADVPGEHVSQCAEFCGLQHANHGLIVVAEPAERFATWVAEQRRPAVATTLRGQEVFSQSNCADCHTISGTPASGTDGPDASTASRPRSPAPAGGPDLTHLASRRTLGSALLPNTPEHLTSFVADPQAIKPGAQMPAPQLSEQDLEALLAYLRSLE